MDTACKKAKELGIKFSISFGGEHSTIIVNKETVKYFLDTYKGYLVAFDLDAEGSS